MESLQNDFIQVWGEMRIQRTWRKRLGLFASQNLF
jgi:hypothetical protein